MFWDQPLARGFVRPDVTREAILVNDPEVDSAHRQVVVWKDDVVWRSSIVLDCVATNLEISFPSGSEGAHHSSRSHNEFLDWILEKIKLVEVVGIL